ncbi:hypothetical protein C8F04DRAFT_1075647 [Mycena alexandri]|uniref:Uncharacterized protein n=1 Tax=Mycena alexandri TaxID=1745969 RepID=A0AAD6TCT6_9AGAR|nr:hypothetical protein C8F04DRAFT_1075647 [Mycena alexandri]
MRFTAAKIAALVAFFALSSSTLAGDVDDNKVGSTLPRDTTALTVIFSTEMQSMPRRELVYQGPVHSETDMPRWPYSRGQPLLPAEEPLSPRRGRWAGRRQRRK